MFIPFQASLFLPGRSGNSIGVSLTAVPIILWPLLWDVLPLYSLANGLRCYITVTTKYHDWPDWLERTKGLSKRLNHGFWYISFFCLTRRFSSLWPDGWGWLVVTVHDLEGQVSKTLVVCEFDLEGQLKGYPNWRGPCMVIAVYDLKDHFGMAWSGNFLKWPQWSVNVTEGLALEDFVSLGWGPGWQCSCMLLHPNDWLGYGFWCTHSE